MKCKNCKHWKNDNGEYGSCDTGKFIEEGERDYKGETDCVVYSYLEGGGMFTGKDFGCIHFEVKR